METFYITIGLVIVVLLCSLNALIITLASNFNKYLKQNESSYMDNEAPDKNPVRVDDVPRLPKDGRTESLTQNREIEKASEERTELLHEKSSTFQPAEEKTVVLTSNEDSKQTNEEKTELLTMERDPSTHLATLKIMTDKTNMEYKMDKDTIHIGRDPEICDVVISDDKYISKHHAILIVKNSSINLIDLNTKNGTYVNGEKITGSHEINSDCIIKIAKSELEFKINR